MSVLIVTAHPEPSSLTSAMAAAVAAGAKGTGAAATVADLAAEGFDPRFTSRDRQVALGTALPAEDVLAEQKRLDAASALALVFPVYWWSMPALLKGWVDRVFARDWAYGYSETGALLPQLRDRPVHVLALAGADAGSFDRHGHAAALDSQIIRGVFGYCGISSAAMTVFHSVDPGVPAEISGHLEQARRIGAALAKDARARASESALC